MANKKDFNFTTKCNKKNQAANEGYFVAVKLPRKMKKAIKNGLLVIRELGRNPYTSDSITLLELFSSGVDILAYVNWNYGCRIPDKKQRIILERAIRYWRYTYLKGYDASKAQREMRKLLGGLVPPSMGPGSLQNLSQEEKEWWWQQY